MKNFYDKMENHLKRLLEANKMRQRRLLVMLNDFDAENASTMETFKISSKITGMIFKSGIEWIDVQFCRLIIHIASKIDKEHS